MLIITATRITKFLFASMAIIFAGCSKIPMQFHGSTMGTSYTVKIPQLPFATTFYQIEQGIALILSKLHAQMSTYEANSEVSRFNNQLSTDWFTVSKDVCEIVVQAQAISQLSNGAFDITVGPLVNLWGFGPAPSRTTPPLATEIQAAKQRVGYQHVQPRCNAVGLVPALRKKRTDVAIDLSAIAQGYGADQVANYLDSLQVQDYLVDVGGELRARGINAQGVTWRIGVEKPISSQRGQVEQILPIKNCAVATSGTYRNFFEANGKHFSHTINPQTGSPVTHNLVSVTVIANTAAAADAWATAISVLGPTQGYEIAKQNNLAVLFIEQTNEEFLEKLTPALISYLQATL